MIVKYSDSRILLMHIFSMRMIIMFLINTYIDPLPPLFGLARKRGHRNTVQQIFEIFNLVKNILFIMNKRS